MSLLRRFRNNKDNGDNGHNDGTTDPSQPQNKAINRVLNNLEESSRRLLKDSVVGFIPDVVRGHPLDAKKKALDHQQSVLDNARLSPDTEMLVHRQQDIDDIQSRLNRIYTVNQAGHSANKFLHEREVSVSLGPVEFKLVNPSEQTTQKLLESRNSK